MGETRAGNAGATELWQCWGRWAEAGKRQVGWVGGHASPLTMFQIAEYHEDDTFLTGEKEPQDPKLTGRGAAGRNKDPASVASGENSELRRRIGSDPPLPDSEAPDEVGAFRARSRSAPPILWAAQRYGQELRRMSDEFHGALQDRALCIEEKLVHIPYHEAKTRLSECGVGEVATPQERWDRHPNAPQVWLEGDSAVMVASKFSGQCEPPKLPVMVFDH
ncbi:Bcl2-associated agonist of cell death, partial [Varanus komodoensis]